MVAGEAVGDVQAVQDRPVEGDHTYVEAPVAARVVEAPAHIVASVPALTVGNGLTVSVAVVEPLQPFAVPVTVYVVVAVGEAITDAPVVALRPVEGVQAYVVAPEAVSVAEEPAQIAAGPLIVTVGFGFTVTVAFTAELQPDAVPVTVYVVVAEGEAIGLEHVVQERPEAGDHE